MKTIIEIQGWGDFDVKYTEGIYYSELKYDRDSLVEEFCKKYNYPSEDGIQNDSLISSAPNKFANFLQGKGFKKLKTEKVLFSD